MLIKAGVDISRLNPEIRTALTEAAEICHGSTDEIVVTSTYDGSHLAGSYHYCNDAFDFTGRDGLEGQWAADLRDILARVFDVVYEGTHIHVEFDRRRFNKKRGS